MKALILAASAGLAIAALAIPASALPGVPKSAAVESSSTVTPIRDHCGPAGWRDRWGHCHYDRRRW